MDLYLCEKPSQAKDLAGVMGIKSREDGYLHDGGSRIITWAYGHLLEQFMPDDYDEADKAWRLDRLPIVPQSWRYKAKNKAAKQLKVIQQLVKKADRIIISTDFDREGEAIARSLLDRFSYSGPTSRLRLTALDDHSIRKALSNILPGSDSEALYYAALARQRADWLVGMNVSRLFTILARNSGYKETLHIGRVITPTVALVCSRDNSISSFTPSPYWVLAVQVNTQNGQFMARWIPPAQCADEQGRCINKPLAEQLANQVKGANGVISKAETKPGKEQPPLPFDLNSLQQYASKRWGYTAQQTLDAAQALYETHKAIHYPRTDSRYLPKSMHEEAFETLQALMLSDPSVSGLVAGADTSSMSRAFNDSKVTAHHGIIPTTAKVNIEAMSEIEARLYDAIRRFYIAQFYADFQFSRTLIEVESCGHTFAAKGKTPLKQGWKVLFNSQDESSPADEGEEDTSDQEQEGLPKVSQGEPAVVGEADLADKMTRPTPHFTEATLLSAMENVAKFVEEEKFRKILKETAGLGTVATRAGIIQGAVDKGYLKRKAKTLRATEKAHALISVVPASIKSPGMTAAWEQELEKIAAGERQMSVFMAHITKWIQKLVSDQIGTAAADEGSPQIQFKVTSHEQKQAECFGCGGVMKRIKGKNGFFWGCQTEACKKTFPDKKGKPVERTPVETGPDCPECGKAMYKRKGKAKDKKRASFFWGCSGYPKCKNTLPFKKETAA